MYFSYIVLKDFKIHIQYLHTKLRKKLINKMHGQKTYTLIYIKIYLHISCAVYIFCRKYLSIFAFHIGHINTE